METLAGVLIGLGLAGLGLLLGLRIRRPETTPPQRNPAEKTPESISAEAEEKTREPPPQVIRDDRHARDVLRRLTERARRKRARSDRERR